jgi:hypothetical protein
MADVAVLVASTMRQASSLRVPVMMKPGKVNGSALMTTFLTMRADMHRSSVVCPVIQFEDST